MYVTDSKKKSMAVAIRTIPTTNDAVDSTRELILSTIIFDAFLTPEQMDDRV